MVANGQIAPLDDLFTPEVLADFNPRELAMNTIDGQIYGIKKVVDTGLVYYRTSLLADAGVQPPTTMDELIAAAQALDSGRTKGIYLGLDGGIGALAHILPWSAGSEFVDPETNQVTFNNERTALAYSKLKELRDTDAVLLGAPTEWWDPSVFIQGQAAMVWGGLWAMPQITTELGEDFSVGPWPALDAEGTPASFIGGWCECVNAKGSQLEAAKAYVKWLWIENAEVQTDFNLSYGFHVPPRISVAAEATALQEGPAAQAVTILNDYGRAQPAVWTGTVNTPLIDAVTNIVQNGADAMGELTSAATRTQEEIDRLAQ
jgi:multiple sugar transport system substrate-binding protein